MPETIGQQLKQARLAKNLSIEKAVQETHIRANALTALEADDFDSLSSPVQARGFLKIYAEYLGLSLTEMYSRQLGETPASLEPAPPMDAPPAPEVETTREEPTAPKRVIKKPRSRKKTGAIPGQAEGAEPAPPPAEKPEGAAAEVKENPPLEASLPQPPPEPPAGEAPGVEAAPLSVSQAIFYAIGSSLRKRRESLGLSLDEIERHTHVRKQSLLLLEGGQFDQLPSSVQTRGMLNNYARFLDMDVDALLLKYAEGLQTRLAERQPPPAELRQPGGKKALKFALPASFRRFLSPDILVGGGMLVLLLIFAIWGTGRIIRLNTARTPEPTAPSISNILLSTPLVEQPTTVVTSDSGSTAAPTGSEATLEITVPPAAEGAVQVVLVATRMVFVRVTVDGEVEFTGRVEVGVPYVFNADTQIEVVTGDGSAVSIIYNQSNMGTMGARGEVVDRIYTATTILLPTATFTPTPTISPTPTITPRPSATLRPSLTPRPSATQNP